MQELQERADGVPQGLAGVSAPASRASAMPRWNSISAATAVWKWKRRGVVA